MSRIPDARFGGVIGEGLARVPALIRSRLPYVQWFCADPVFAGLHAYDTTTDGRSYRTTAHCLYPVHLVMRPRSERVTTIVLTGASTPETVVHEYGHALHQSLSFDTPTPKPVTRYAGTNTHEAFAEAFTAWLNPHYGDQDVLASDAEALAFFERLVA